MTIETQSTCPYCGVGCGVVARVDGENVTIKGDPNHPANFGRLCSKGSALDETLDLEGRLLYPEVDGQQTDWDSALATVADRFKAIIDTHGREAIAFYVSGQLLTEDYYVANKLMKGFIGSANIDTNSRLCMASAVAGYKRAFGSDTVPCNYEDLERAKLVVLTGSNLAWCHPVLYQRLVRAKKDNPDLVVVVIDPRRTATCDLADLHLPIRPGTDSILFNGLLTYLDQDGEHNTLFTANYCEGLDGALNAARYTAPDMLSVAKQCGLALEKVDRFFRLFARSERVVTVYSQGVNQSSSGTDKANAIINVHLFTGRIGRPGMGPFSMTGQPNAMGGREVGGLANQLAAHLAIDNPEHRQWVQRFWHAPRIAEREGLKAVDLFQAIERGHVKAVWIMGTNPVVSLPESHRVREALRACELVVVSDNMARTDTVDMAQIKLPALAWGEKEGTVTNSERRISRQRAFLTPPGTARPDWWIVSEVAKRMGFGEAFDYPDSHTIFVEFARLTATKNNGSRDLDLSGLAGLTAEEYAELLPVQWPVTRTNRKGSARMFGDGRFFTDNGRARFIAVTPRPPAIPVDSELPLLLNTGRVRDHWHTLTRSGKSPRLSTHIQEPFAAIHPEDAERYRITDGGLVRLAGKSGHVIVRARIEAEQQRGSLFAPIHWNGQFASSALIDGLISAVTDPISGQPESKHAPVRIEPYNAAWYGFLLSRRRLPINDAEYWVVSRGNGFWRYQLAGDHPPSEWEKQARALLCSQSEDVGWVEYFDPNRQQYRAARLVNNALESCLYIGPEVTLPPHDWLEPLFAKERIDDRERIALLAGRPLNHQADEGPTVCACFGVKMETIKSAIAAGDLTTVEAIGAKLKAGTNCGSCIPELRKLLRTTSH